MTQAADGSPSPPSAGVSSRGRWIRLGALLAVLAALAVVGYATGLADGLSLQKVRASIQSAGVLGVGLYIGAFALAILLYLPGTAFIAAGALVYGQGPAIPIALAAAVVAVTVNFWVARSIGGNILTEVKRPFLQKMLATLDRRPLTTVIILRTVFWMSPPMNYALALTNLRTRHYLIGSVIGLAGPVTLVCLLVGYFV